MSQAMVWSLIDLAAAPGIHALTFAAGAESLHEGDLARLVFLRKLDARTERLWVRVLRQEGGGYVGEMYNTSALIPGLGSGRRVAFEPRHVMTVFRSAPTSKPPPAKDVDSRGNPRRRVKNEAQSMSKPG